MMQKGEVMCLTQAETKDNMSKFYERRWSSNSFSSSSLHHRTKHTEEATAAAVASPPVVPVRQLSDRRLNLMHFHDFDSSQHQGDVSPGAPPKYDKEPHAPRRSASGGINGARTLPSCKRPEKWKTRTIRCVSAPLERSGSSSAAA